MFIRGPMFREKAHSRPRKLRYFNYLTLKFLRLIILTGLVGELGAALERVLGPKTLPNSEC